MTAPPNSPSRGNDIGWWASSYQWHSEIDFFEYWGYQKNLHSTEAGTCIMIYHTSPTTKSTNGGSAVIPELFDPHRPHRYTHVIYPDATMSMWVDGKKIQSVGGGRGRTSNILKSWPKDPLALILSFGLRNLYIDAVTMQKELDSLRASGGSKTEIADLQDQISNIHRTIRAPNFKDSRSMHVRSIAVYQDKAHAGKGFTGGGVAPGTVVKGKGKRATKSRK